jgi:hypothetical protein
VVLSTGEAVTDAENVPNEKETASVAGKYVLFVVVVIRPVKDVITCVGTFGDKTLNVESLFQAGTPFDKEVELCSGTMSTVDKLSIGYTDRAVDLPHSPPVV